MSGEASAFQAAQIEHVAKICYEKLVEDLTKAIANGEQLIVNIESDPKATAGKYTVAITMMSLHVSQALQRASEDVKRFGVST